jgi:hypothetical protein
MRLVNRRDQQRLLGLKATLLEMAKGEQWISTRFAIS